MPINFAQTSIVASRDGSHTLRNELSGEHYHSIFGAYTESMHVFAVAGLEALQLEAGRPLRLLEVGLGTGLNALIAARYSAQHPMPIDYLALEPYPVHHEQLMQLNYADYVGAELLTAYQEAYPALLAGEPWEHGGFRLQVQQQKIEQWSAAALSFDLIFYDAFSPTSQADMWDDAAIDRVAACLAPGGLLVTYCIRGHVRRHFMAQGLLAEKLPGPPGKREMLRIKRPVHV
ncbi:MAG: tRNA (5-methylaminomethyl-2-thiouridine)(34)-methyltransferase MnmD [Bacteroidia bacterium]